MCFLNFVDHENASIAGEHLARVGRQHLTLKPKQADLH